MRTVVLARSWLAVGTASAIIYGPKWLAFVVLALVFVNLSAWMHAVEDER